MAVEDFKGHPSPMIKTEDVAPAEKVWKEKGSGIIARTLGGIVYLPQHLRDVKWRATCIGESSRAHHPARLWTIVESTMG